MSSDALVGRDGTLRQAALESPQFMAHLLPGSRGFTAWRKANPIGLPLTTFDALTPSLGFHLFVIMEHEITSDVQVKIFQFSNVAHILTWSTKTQFVNKIRRVFSAQPARTRLIADGIYGRWVAVASDGVAEHEILKECAIGEIYLLAL